jgi:hypothetical protein
MGSIALPGALVMANNDLSASVLNRLQIQLHIDETITGQEFDVRFAADPSYPNSLRALRQRLLVLRDFRESTNRTEFDVVIYIKESMAYIEQNCFGPTGASYYLTNLYWGQLCIFDTQLDRSCSDHGCGGSVSSNCGCGSVDGYGRSPYYPARFDPEYPKENHWYNQVRESHVFSSTGSCGQSRDRVLCRRYFCDTHGNVIPQLDCRLVKQ